MIIAGIIAEYNPMHEGHKYLIQQVREHLHADLVIVAMSGSFTQRGIPAFFDKFSRTEAALNAGCDIILELPVTVSTGSAEIFAIGAIKALKAFGITHLAFGSECGDITKLSELSDLLLNETDEFSHLVKEKMSTGSTYPQAIKFATSELYPEYSCLLDTPNNTLGLEYLKAIKTYAKDIIPYTTTRIGAGYNDTDATVQYPSATALREKLSKENTTEFLTSDDFTEALTYKLLQANDAELLTYADITPEFINRLNKLRTSDMSFTALAEALKTKQLTFNKVSRALFHILLGVTDTDYSQIKAAKPSYVRVLGLRESAGKYLKLIKENSSIAILTRLAQDEKNLSEQQKEALSKDKASYSLYSQVFYYKYKKSLEKEFRGLILIKN